jgi:hypothetical protein
MMVLGLRVSDSLTSLRQAVKLLESSRPNDTLVQDAVTAAKDVRSVVLVAVPALQQLEKQEKEATAKAQAANEELKALKVHASSLLARITQDPMQDLVQLDNQQQADWLELYINLEGQKRQLQIDLQQLLDYGRNDTYKLLCNALHIAAPGQLNNMLQCVRGQLIAELQNFYPATAPEAAAEPFPAGQSGAAAATDAAASLAAEPGQIQFSAELTAELASEYTAAAPCSLSAQAVNCSTFDASCPPFFSSTSSIPADYCNTAAAAVADGTADSSFYAAPSWCSESMFGSASSMPANPCSSAAAACADGTAGGGYYAAPSWGCERQFDSEYSMPADPCSTAAAAAADSTAASSSTGCMPCNMTGFAVADELPQVRSAGGCSQAEAPAGCGFVAELAAAAAPSSSAAGCKDNKAAAAGLLIGWGSQDELSTASCVVSSISSSMPEQCGVAPAAADSTAQAELVAVNGSSSGPLRAYAQQQQQQGLLAAGGLLRVELFEVAGGNLISSSSINIGSSSIGSAIVFIDPFCMGSISTAGSISSSYAFNVTAEDGGSSRKGHSSSYSSPAQFLLQHSPPVQEQRPSTLDGLEEDLSVLRCVSDSSSSSSSLLSSTIDGSEHICSDLDSSTVEVHVWVNYSSSSSLSSISSKSSLLAADDGPATPAVVSLAASCAASARTSCAECSDGGSSRSSDNDAALSSNSSKQQQCGASRGGFMSRVVGCVVGPLRELLLHATG